MEYKEKIDFVNDFSLLLEETGRPRIMGQIFGWLLICDPPQQSFPDLMENLDISKASVSNITRILLEQGMIEKVRVKGERQIYFQLKQGSISDFIEKQINEILKMRSILNSGLELAKSTEDTSTSRLEQAVKFHSFLAEEMPALLKRYKP